MKRKIASAAAVALAFTALVLPADAADSFPPIGEQTLASAQPRFSGYRVQEIRDWSPQTDPYAEFLRAEVPLQPRIGRLAQTQANPSLDGKAEIMLMQGDYGNAFFNTPMQNNDFAQHTLNFWQYTDYFSPWHGAATASTPSSLYDPKTSDWRNRGFEFGIVNIPNPAYTNAAHRNGVKSIATIYFDPAFRPGLTFTESFPKNPQSQGYIIAEKLLEMAHYYNFDGYFLNQEEYGDDSEFKPFMAYLTSKGLYTQWYDTNNNFNASKAEWLKDDTHGQIHDSVFVNYGWPSSVDRSLSYAASTGVDPHKSLFFGVEANQAKFSGGHGSATSLDRLFASGTKNPRASIALFTPSDFYQRGLDDDVRLPEMTKELPLMQQNAFQWMIAERERMYFSGVRSNPRQTGMQPGFSRPEVGLSNASRWYGVADFTAERSVIGGTQFHSTFNTGHGMQWFADGKVSNPEQWTNINVQSLLPTWQWWLDTDGKRPSVDFDYGTAMQRKSTTGADVASPFAPQGAWRGGSSLVVHGDLTADATLRLFKTDLAVSKASRMQVTFKKSSKDSAPMKAALIFADAPSEVVTLEVADSASSGEWRTSTIDLAPYAGRKLATIGLQFGAASGYQMNVGEISLTDGASAPAAPTGVKLKRVYDDGQVVIGWNKAKFAEVDGYVIEATYPDGHVAHLTGGYTDLAHVKRVANTSGAVKFGVRAVGKDGRVSEPATVSYDYSAQPRKLAVAQAETPSGLLTQARDAGKLSVTWDAAGSAGRTCQVDVALVGLAKGNVDDQPYGVSVPCSDAAAEVPVPVKEGYTYDLTVTPKGQTMGIAHRGQTHDALAAPMPQSDFEFSNGRVVVHSPTTKDWWKIDVSFAPAGADDAAAQRIVAAKRGDRSNQGLQSPRTLPASDGTLLVTLTDYSGNVTLQRIPISGGVPTPDTTRPALTVTNAPTQTVEFGDAMTPIKVVATDASAVAIEVSDLPKGLQWRNVLPGVPEAPRARSAAVSPSPLEPSGTNGGVLSGTPATLGTHTVTVTAVDAYGNKASQDLRINVADTSAPVFTPESLPAMRVELGSALAPVKVAAVDAADGPVKVVVDEATPLPAGVTLADGVLSGTPRAVGSTSVTLRAADASGNTATLTTTITVVDTTKPALTADHPDPQKVSLGEAITPVTFSVKDASGEAPITVVGADGLTLKRGDDGSVTVSGTPTRLGRITLVATAKDASGNSTTVQVVIDVVDTAAPVITPIKDATLELGEAIAPIALKASDGHGPVAVTIKGSLPAGLTVADGKVDGAPSELGTFPVTLVATGKAGNTAQLAWTITVRDTVAPKVSVPASVAGTVGAEIDPVLIAATDAGAVRLTASGLPDGVRFVTTSQGGRGVSATATLAGAPTRAGTVTVTVRATDASGNVGEASFTLTVRAASSPKPTPKPSTPPAPSPTPTPVTPKPGLPNTGA